MTPGISEFSYGYALTDELVHSPLGGLRAAPFFPSLIAEGKSGYDVRLQFPGLILFLQFKLSHRMLRRSALEYRRHNLPIGPPPFFRFHIYSRKRSMQHQLMLDLEREGNPVYYAAPLFDKILHLDSAYLNSDVAARSVFVRPSAIGRINDDAAHHVAFTFDGRGWCLSEPRRIKGQIDHEAFLSNLTRRIESQEVPLSEVIGRTASAMRAIAARRDGYDVIGERRDQLFADNMGKGDEEPPDLDARWVSYIARTYFGCEPILLTRDQ